MKKVAVITPPDGEYGFGLAGVLHRACRGEDAEAVLKDVITRSDIALVIVDERLIRNIEEDNLREIEQGWQGILLTLPAVEKPGVQIKDYAAELIQRVIGYHIRL